jgi:hypothetical protein
MILMIYFETALNKNTLNLPKSVMIDFKIAVQIFNFTRNLIEMLLIAGIHNSAEVWVVHT